MDILYYLDHNFERDHRRPHLIALAKYCRILCVEPPINIFSALIDLRSSVQVFISRRRLRKVSSNIYICKPLTLFPYFVVFRLPFVHALNRRLLALSLGPILRGLGFHNLVSFITCPQEEYVIGLFNEEVVCFEYYDAYIEHPGRSDRAKRYMEKVEKRTLKRVNVVFASAHNLYERKRRLNPNTYFVPNAADAKFFMKCLDANTPIPQELNCIDGQLLGLVGNINEIVDIRLLNYLAQRNPGWSIVLIGAVNGSRRFKRSDEFIRSLQLPNIHYLGFKPYESLPNYLKGLDVCLLPYKINEYTRCVYPNKLHQYLSGGKPVVSTDLPEMRYFEGIIKIARNYEEFEGHVSEALQQDNHELRKKRVELAKENSCNVRGKQKAEILLSYLQQTCELKQIV